MKIVELMQKSVEEKKHLYVIKNDELFKIWHYGNGDNGYSSLYYQKEYDEWEVAGFSTLWMVEDDYLEVSVEEFNELMQKQGLF